MPNVSSFDMPSTNITSLKRRASDDLRDNKTAKRLKAVFGSDVSDENIGEVNSAQMSSGSSNESRSIICPEPSSNGNKVKKRSKRVKKAPVIDSDSNEELKNTKQNKVSNGSDDSIVNDEKSLMEHTDSGENKIMGNKTVFMREVQKGDTSDTSIEDVEGKSELTWKKKDKKENKAIEGGKKERSTSDASCYRLAKLKKMVIMAGMRFNYKKLFKDVPDNSKQRIKVIEKEMESRGLSHPFTIESCKAFKLQKEEEVELAELAKNSIIDIGEDSKIRVTRSKRAAVQSTKRKIAITEDSSDGELEERERVKHETQSLFSNLCGIVSDDAESD